MPQHRAPAALVDEGRPARTAACNCTIVPISDILDRRHCKRAPSGATGYMVDESMREQLPHALRVPWKGTCGSDVRHVDGEPGKDGGGGGERGPGVSTRIVAR